MICRLFKLTPFTYYSLFEDVPRIFFPLLWFEQKVRITPELASELKVIPCVLLGGQIFAGILFAIGLIMLGWYPIQHLCSFSRRRHSIKIHGSENGIGKMDQVKACELKPLKDNVQEKEKSLDQSPLLEKCTKVVTTSEQPHVDSKSNGNSNLN